MLKKNTVKPFFSPAFSRVEFLERQKVLEEMIQQNSNADLAFMIDCTGSMSSYIDTTKSQIAKIVKACVAEFENQVHANYFTFQD